MKKIIASSFALFLVMGSLTGCHDTDRGTKGAIIGGAVGVGVGAAAGGGTGAAIGGVTGAVVGHHIGKHH